MHHHCSLGQSVQTSDMENQASSRQKEEQEFKSYQEYP